MTKLLSKLTNFMAKPDVLQPLAFFRISLGIFCIVKLVVLYPHLLDIYGQYGYVQWAVTKAGLYPGLPHLGDLALWLQRFGINADETVYICFYSYIFLFTMLTFGLFSRITSVLCWYFHLAWMNTGSGFMYGVDVFTALALFYMLFMPVGNYYSLDVFLHIVKKKTHTISAGVTRKLLQIQMCLVYGSSGIEKALGYQWWNGEAIWKSFVMPSFRQFDMTWLADYPLIPMLIGWSVLFIEIGYIVAVWIPNVRLIWIGLIVMLHFFIGLFMGMWLFTAIMIILSFAAFGYEVQQDWKKRFATRKASVLSYKQ